MQDPPELSQLTEPCQHWAKQSKEWQATPFSKMRDQLGRTSEESVWLGLSYAELMARFIKCGSIGDSTPGRANLCRLVLLNCTTMARNSSPLKLSEVLREYLRKAGLSAPIGRAQAVVAWEDLAGPQIMRVTDSVWVRDKKLFVKLTSSVWRHELHMQRFDWLAKLHSALGSEEITEIVFR